MGDLRAAVWQGIAERVGAGVGTMSPVASDQAVPIPRNLAEFSDRLDDLRALRDCGTALNGAISGRALYDGAIDLREALAELRG